MFRFTKKEDKNKDLFMSEQEFKEYTEQYVDPEPTDESVLSPNMILSKNFKRPINPRKIIGNSNVVIVGDNAVEESKTLIKSNILQMNASFVVNDPLGEMARALGTTLTENGYAVKVLNLEDLQNSNGYNPLNYIRDDGNACALADCLIQNTSTKESKKDVFSKNIERNLLTACILYLINYCEDESRKNFRSVLNMIHASFIDEKNPNAKPPLDVLFETLPEKSSTLKFYNWFRDDSEEVRKEASLSCAMRLQPFLNKQVVDLTRKDELHLERLNNEKTALFIVTPSSHSECSFLVPILYNQLFSTLCDECERERINGGEQFSKLPVRCMMNDFANSGEILEFPPKLATMCMYNISATMVIENIHQMESIYHEDWKCVFGNSSSFVVLRSSDPETVEYFSEHERGKQKNKLMELLTNMPSDKCIVYTLMSRPYYDERFVYEKHPRYQFTADANKDYTYRYNEIYDCSSLDLTGLLKKKRETTPNVVFEPFDGDAVLKRYKEEIE